MADLTDVLQALVDLSAAAVYPSGTAQPSVCGNDVVVYAGWCIASRLDDDLKLLKTHVSVYARSEETNTTRLQPFWDTVEIYPATITLTVAGNTVIVGGAVADKQNATLVINNQPYSYTVQATDTLQSIAQALAALIAVDLNVIVTGSVIEIPTAYSITARVGTKGLTMRELRRQERVFQIVVWAATPQLRDTVASAIDKYLASYLLDHGQQITLVDQSKARVTYKGSPITDDLQKDRLFRRDLLLSIDYATTETREDYVITATELNYTTTVINEIDISINSTASTVSIIDQNVPDVQRTISHPFSFGDVTTVNICAIQAGSVISGVELVLTTAFDVASSIYVGDLSHHQSLFDIAGLDLMQPGSYESKPAKYYAASSNIIVTLNAGSGVTQGAGVIIITIEE